MTQPASPPPQRPARGGRQALDSQWLAYIARTAAIGDPQAIAATDRFRQGISAFNEARFRASHETWESLWIESPYPQRLFLLALAKLGAGFAHALRRNPKGVRQLLEDALRIAKPFAPSYAGVDIERLSHDIKAWLRSGSYDAPFPTIARIPGEPLATPEKEKEKASPFP